MNKSTKNTDLEANQDTQSVSAGRIGHLLWPGQAQRRQAIRKSLEPPSFEVAKENMREWLAVFRAVWLWVVERI
jgi:hypothetical protein